LDWIPIILVELAFFTYDIRRVINCAKVRTEDTWKSVWTNEESWKTKGYFAWVKTSINILLVYTWIAKWIIRIGHIPKIVWITLIAFRFINWRNCCTLCRSNNTWFAIILDIQSITISTKTILSAINTIWVNLCTGITLPINIIIKEGKVTLIWFTSSRIDGWS